VGWTNEDWGSLPGRKKKFPFLHSIQSYWGTPTPLSSGYQELSPRAIAVGKQNCPIWSIWWWE